ncbi:MAG: class I adenylate-forming enzyme family protein [Gammaproteobacteria bacterium]
MRSLAGWIERHAAIRPAAAAIRHADRRVSYGELAGRAAVLEAWLADGLGLVRGARVAWLGLNSVDEIAALFACANAGYVFVPLNWRLSGEELAAILEDAAPGVLVVDAGHVALAEATGFAPCAGLGFDHAGWARVPEAADGMLAVRDCDVTAPVLLVYTSGTTGRPKGAVLSQRALLFNALNSIHMHDLSRSDRVLTVLPLFHVGGMNIQTLPALYAGAEVILAARFDPEETVALVAQHRPTLMVLVPAIIATLQALDTWCALDLGCVRAVTTGSTDVPVSLIEALHARGVPVIQIYGATETGPVAIYQCIDEAEATLGSIGRCGLHTAVRLVDTEGRDVPDGVPGEILVRGPHVASGYWNASAEEPLPFDDGWFASGDVAERDGRGVYWFRDRIKHVIISGGENIYPAELERILNACPDLREAAVAGRRDERWGEVPVVVAVAEIEGALDEATVLALFDDHIARFKRPQGVLFVDALPRNVMGKVEVPRLRELVNGEGG